MKTIRIFLRDMKVAFRQFVTLWIMIVPIVLAFMIGTATPGAADTPIRIAMLRGENTEQIAYLERFALVELFEDMASLEKRVKERDDIPAIIPDGEGGYVILMQGSEPGYLIDAVKALKTYQELNIQVDPSKAAFNDFGRTDPPIKIMLSAVLVMLVTVLSGMLISINIVDEKADRTIRAVRVAPVPINSFVIGKSLIGVTNSIACCSLCVLAAGFFDVNFLHILVLALSLSFISFIVGFLTGLTSDDFISAAAALKLMFLPFAASVLAIELLAEKWHRLFYWSPFYWSYDGIKGVLAQTANWETVLLDAGMTIALSFIVYFMFYPSIKRRLI